MYTTVGDFGWFFGDFFIDTAEVYRTDLRYTGIYRFLNNPDCVTGCAGFYGAALMIQSWDLFWLALVSQIMNILFLVFVEAPHMQRLYDMRRKEDPVSRELKSIANLAIKKIVPNTLQDDVRKLKTKLKSKYQVKVDEVKEDIKRQLHKVHTKVSNPDHAAYSALRKKLP
jgi:phosphatidylethanolamine N-methyltransferase